MQVEELPSIVTLRTRRQGFLLSVLPTSATVATTRANILQDTFFPVFMSTTAMKDWAAPLLSPNLNVVLHELLCFYTLMPLEMFLNKIMSVVQHLSSHETNEFWTSFILNFSMKGIFCFRWFQHSIKGWLNINIKDVDILKNAIVIVSIYILN